MSYYFANQDNTVLRAVTPRVASTSQREYWPTLGYRPVDAAEARKIQRGGAEVIGVMRNPIMRLGSAYRRTPSNWDKPFLEFVCERATWDSHVMPQHDVHGQDGIEVDTWELFSEFIETPGLPHKNGTPEDNKYWAMSLTEDWIEWYRETYLEDIKVFAELADGKLMTAG